MVRKGTKTKTKTKTKDQLLSTPSRKLLFEHLLKGLNIKQAAKEASLDYKYARNWVAKSGINAIVLRETSTKTRDLRAEAIQSLTKVARNEETKPETAIKAWDSIGKMSGWHVTTVKIESSQRQHELDSAARIEASRLADLRCGLLPGSVAMAKQVDSVTGDIAGHGDIVSVADGQVDGDTGHSDIDNIATDETQSTDQPGVSLTNVKLDNEALEDPIAPQKVDGPQ